MKTKRCPQCRRTLFLNQFYKDRSRKSKLLCWCKDCVSRKGKEYRNKNKERISQRHKEQALKLKIEVLSHYAGGLPKCACCDDLHIEFLGIDHIDGGGAKHRKKVGGSGQVYRWLRKNGYPKGYRVLCNNCNASFGLYGYCPHKSNKILKRRS